MCPVYRRTRTAATILLPVRKIVHRIQYIYLHAANPATWANDEHEQKPALPLVTDTLVNVYNDDMKNFLLSLCAQSIGKFIIYLHIVTIIHETKGKMQRT